METAFPRVVVIDPEKRHHLFIYHTPTMRLAKVTCLDCGDCYNFPDNILPAYIERVRQDKDTQVVTWVQDNG